MLLLYRLLFNKPSKQPKGVTKKKKRYNLKVRHENFHINLSLKKAQAALVYLLYLSWKHQQQQLASTDLVI